MHELHPHVKGFGLSEEEGRKEGRKKERKKKKRKKRSKQEEEVQPRHVIG